MVAGCGIVVAVYIERRERREERGERREKKYLNEIRNIEY